MRRAAMIVACLGLTAGCASAPRVPERDLSQVRIGMSERDVAAVWGAARTMYKIEKTASGCVERHVFGVVAGSPRRPANIDFDAQRRVCAVGPVEVPNTEAPLLAAELAPPPQPVAAAAAPVAAAPGVTAPPATGSDDVVILKSGRQIHGKVADGSPNGPVTITLGDGTTRTIARAKVKRVEKGS